MVKVLWVPTADYWVSQQGVNDHLTRGTGREKARATCCVLASRDNCVKATSAIGDLLQSSGRPHAPCKSVTSQDA